MTTGEKSQDQIIKEKIIKKAWEDATFKNQLIEDPKAALKEAFGIELPEDFKITAVEETSKDFYLVIPVQPSQTLEDEPAAPNGMW